MLLDLKDIDQESTPLVSMSVFCKDYADNITLQGLIYAMKHDLIDYIMVGDRRVVVLTPKSKQYSPNKNTKRTIMNA